jgi:hypothetical protein
MTACPRDYPYLLLGFVGPPARPSPPPPGPRPAAPEPEDGRPAARPPCGVAHDTIDEVLVDSRVLGVQGRPGWGVQGVGCRVSGVGLIVAPFERRVTDP